MPSVIGRRSRSRYDSDDDPSSSREATPLSTAPDDAKRARRGFPSDRATSEDDESEDSLVVPVESRAQGSSVKSNTRRATRAITEDDVDSEHTVEVEDENEEEDVEERDRHPLNRMPTRETLEKSGRSHAGIKRKHQPGAIVRVKVTNFVTYTSAEFFPGPNLNMVIGPNGTGKSSLVCAICLGLGWGPQHLGRAKEVSEFIKNGCREATIEIELQRAEKGAQSQTNPIFTRHMKRDGNKSTYLINGAPASNKQVMALARSFSVQIDNLCQFLPQDRVVEFSQMSPENLLHSTQRAIAPELLEYHENLVKIRQKQKDVFIGRKHDKEQLKNLEGRQEGQRLEVENTRRRAEVKEKLSWLEKCRPMLLYTDAVAKFKAAKELRLQLVEEVKQLERELAPTLQRVNDKQKYEEDTRALKLHRVKQLKDVEKGCDKLEKDMSKCDEKMQELETVRTNERKSMSDKKKTRLNLLRSIQNLTRQIEVGQDPFDLAAINDDIRQKAARISELDSSKEENRERYETLQTQVKARVAASRALKAQCDELDTRAGQQLSKLEIASKDTHTAWKWIQGHQNAFEKEVFGPPMVTCSLKDPKMANAVEALFQDSDFKIITVQCQQDFNTCQKIFMRDQGLSDISVRVCSTQTLEQFQRPLSQETLQSLGLDGWAIDYLEGPSTVIALLCQERSLHQNAIGARDISEAQYEAIKKEGLRSFVAGSTSYRFIDRTEYGEAGKTTSTKTVRPGRFWSAQSVDHGLKAQLMCQINEKKGEALEIHAAIQEVKDTLTKIVEELTPLTEDLNRIRGEKAERQKAQADFARLPHQKAEAETKLNAADDFLEGVRARLKEITAEEDQTVLRKAEVALEYAKTVSKQRNLNADLLEAELMHIEALSDFQTLQLQNADLHNLVETRKKEVTYAKKVEDDKRAEAQDHKRQFESLRAEGNKLADEHGNSALNDLIFELIDKHKSEAGFTTDDLEADIDTLKADLELAQGGDQRVVDEFEKREDTIRLLKERLGASSVKANELTAQIRAVRAKWEDRLDELVAIISEKFGENFARIGCAGSVSVHKASVPADEIESETETDPTAPDQNAGENGLDFANWALHISVKFRENEPLSLLDSHRQSGGERAVSTIFYLMALQSLSRAPFRVVDEINQGMDPRNERMVHGRMVDIAAGNGEDGKGGSQYFLVTPKLLSGLKYKEGMTVLCIVSGENMPAVQDSGALAAGRNRVDFRMLVQKARELGLRKYPAAAEAVGRRVDSGVALGSSFADDDDSMYGDGDGEEPESLGHGVVGKAVSVAV